MLLSYSWYHSTMPAALHFLHFCAPHIKSYPSHLLRPQPGCPLRLQPLPQHLHLSRAQGPALRQPLGRSDEPRLGGCAVQGGTRRVQAGPCRVM